VASKVNPFPSYGESLTPESVKAQAAAILESLKTPKVDILYLHAPDIHNPIEATLAGPFVYSNPSY
jgi:aryl-alcohol dehydrogenase-like predicted oxidoreductase